MKRFVLYLPRICHSRQAILSFGQMDMSKNNDKAKRPEPTGFRAVQVLPMAKRSASDYSSPAR